VLDGEAGALDLAARLPRGEQIDVAELLGRAVELARDPEDEREFEQSRHQFDRRPALRGGQHQRAAGAKRAEQAVDHRLRTVRGDMLEHFGADGEVVRADPERLGRVEKVGLDLVERLHIVEEGGIDIDRADAPPGFAQRFGEHAATDPDLEHAVALPAVPKRLAEHPVAARAVEPAAGRIAVLVELALEIDIALAGPCGLAHAGHSPTRSLTT